MNRQNKEPKECSAFFSLICWAVMAFITVAWVVSSVLLCGWIYFFSKARAQIIFHSVAVLWAKSILGVLRIWKVEFYGSNLLLNRNHLVIANHQSIIDILVALATVPIPFKFMAKRELFSIPFLGWHMTLAGYIPVERSSPEGRKAAVQKAKECLRSGDSLLMFPEGTRSLDGQMLPFKPGAFKLAQSEQVPLLPVVICGSMDAIRKKSWRVARNVVIRVKIEKSVVLSEDEEVITEKIQEIRDRMICNLGNLKPNVS